MGKKRTLVSAAAASNPTSPKIPQQRGIEIPDVADMGALTGGGTLREKPVFDEQLHCFLLEYAQNGSLYSPTFSDGKLWVLQMATSQVPSPLYQMKKMVELFGLAEANAADPPPETREEVALRYGASNQFVWKKTDDTDVIGWIKTRTGWYVDEKNIKDFLMYFDDMMHWRKGFENGDLEKIVGDIKIVIHMQTSAALELSLDPRGHFEMVREEVPTMSVFDLPPPIYPARIVILTFQVLEPEKAHGIFVGNTKPVQAGFVKHNIKGKL
jgi:hypothetical protein